MNVVSLTRHPSTACPYAHWLTVRVDWTSQNRLVLGYSLVGDVDSLQLPPPAQPERADGLWKHTCFEAFIAAPRTRAYVELNFSPSKQWAAYRFDDYRQGMSPIAALRAPEIVCTRGEENVDVRVSVDLTGLEDLTATGLKLALAAVLQSRNGDSCYWALAHAPGRPDFHRPEGFALTLPAPTGEA